MDPAICHGKPCIRGLRYPVENIQEWLSSGMGVEEILADYEDLEREDILKESIFAVLGGLFGVFLVAKRERRQAGIKETNPG